MGTSCRDARVEIVGLAHGGGLEGVIETVHDDGRRITIELLLADGSARHADLDPDDWDWLELRAGDIVDLNAERAAGPQAGRRPTRPSGGDVSVDDPAALLRQAMSQFATGVTIVTSLTGDGRPIGTTATAVSSLSLVPPLLLVCLDRRSATLAAIVARQAFAINILAAHQQHLSSNFAKRGEAASWDGVAHDRWPSGNPRLDGALASVDCIVDELLAGGDHDIVIGHVTGTCTTGASDGPLLHWRGRYAELDEPN
jgi:flavin reductase (DIM6/NTAB) family NADH-FMN oxidoreductase RutF